jgi:hypothetical protein
MLTRSVNADTAPFDLAGPNLEVKVTRGATTLPISEVPNLAPGDQLWIQADLPTTQAAHFVMVAAFLRGATNPPPESWFFRCETWTRKCAQASLSIIVPQDAQQMLLFLAPQTGGDFKTLVDAVRGRPGSFVRASQDLNQATLDRSRLDNYLAAIRTLNDADPAKLKEVAPLLARSLAIKVDQKCLDRIPELQAPCLMQGENSLILDDGHSTSIVEALTSDTATDLAMEASYTPQLSYGYFSPYVASLLDIARLLDSFHTAQYQYIPALASGHGARLALALNAPPSFHNPKSVLVVALPAIEETRLPPLHAVDPKEIYCAKKTVLALPVEGAPLVFSTGYAHDIVLTLSGKDGGTIELPAKADALQGGFVVDTSTLVTASLGDSVRGSLHGYWGFDKYAGPEFELVNARAQTWEMAAKDAGTLIVGREDTVHLQAESASCINTVMLEDPDGKELKVDWKTIKPNELEVKLPLQQAKPGAMTLIVRQYGAGQPQSVQIHTFSEVARLQRFVIHAGDTQGILSGSRLDEVANLVMMGIEFIPGTLSTGGSQDEMPVVAQDERAAAALQQGATAIAKVTLHDGRVITLNASVDEPRPSVKIIGKSVQASASSGVSNIRLTNQDELPQDAKLIFSIRAQTPRKFARDVQIEVATADDSFSTTLSVINGGITLENTKVAVATLDPAKAFGSSASGPLQFRMLAKGGTGDWQPLATLVRLPVLTGLICPSTPELACKLSGSSLYLVASVSGNAQFDHPMRVPDGFPGFSLPVPHPTDGQLYVKLRDDPSVVNLASLGTQQLPPPSAEEDARAVARQAAVSAENDSVASSDANQPLPTGGAAEQPPAPQTPAAQGTPAQAQDQLQIDPSSNSENGAVRHTTDEPTALHST